MSTATPAQTPSPPPGELNPFRLAPTYSLPRWLNLADYYRGIALVFVLLGLGELVVRLLVRAGYPPGWDYGHNVAVALSSSLTFLILTAAHDNRPSVPITAPRLMRGMRLEGNLVSVLDDRLLKEHGVADGILAGISTVHAHIDNEITPQNIADLDALHAKYQAIAAAVAALASAAPTPVVTPAVEPAPAPASTTPPGTP